MRKRVVAVSLFLAAALGTAAFAQLAPNYWVSDDCSTARGQVRTGMPGDTPVDISTATLITLDEFVRKSYPSDDPKKRPSLIAPHSRVEGEGILYRIDDLELRGFQNCFDSIGLQFGLWGTHTGGTISALFPSSQCLTGDLLDIVNAQRTRYMKDISVWGENIWRGNVTACGYSGGEGDKKDRHLSLIGYSWWDDYGGISTPVLKISPIIAILTNDGTDPTTTGGGGTPTSPSDLSIVLPKDFLTAPVTIGNSEAVSIDFSTRPGSSFNSPVSLYAFSDAEENSDLSVSVTPTTIAAPGAGSGKLTISTGPLTFPRDYRVTLVARANGKDYPATIRTTFVCDPPMILGANQPASQTVTSGQVPTLKVVATGSKPFYYQWYAGHSGQTAFPQISGNSDTYRPVGNSYGSAEYWVRVTNACGSTDSMTATVNLSLPTNTSRKRR